MNSGWGLAFFGLKEHVPRRCFLLVPLKALSKMISSLEYITHIEFYDTRMKQERRFTIMVHKSTKDELSKLGDLNSSYESLILNLIKNAKLEPLK